VLTGKPGLVREQDRQKPAGRAEAGSRACRRRAGVQQVKEYFLFKSRKEGCSQYK
jgi:hypothetical protein